MPSQPFSDVTPLRSIKGNKKEGGKTKEIQKGKKKKGKEI